jgi:hypothetical protein
VSVTATDDARFRLSTQPGVGKPHDAVTAAGEGGRQPGALVAEHDRGALSWRRQKARGAVGVEGPLLEGGRDLARGGDDQRAIGDRLRELGATRRRPDEVLARMGHLQAIAAGQVGAHVDEPELGAEVAAQARDAARVLAALGVDQDDDDTIERAERHGRTVTGSRPPVKRPPPSPSSLTGR